MGKFWGAKVIRDLQKIKEMSDIIVVNHVTDE